MREPDALDGARVLALGLAAYAGLGLLSGRMPEEGVRAALQISFLAIPVLYARAAGLAPLASNGVRRMSLLSLACVATASLASLWLVRELVELSQWGGRELGMGERFAVQEEEIRRTVEAAREKGLAAAALLFVVASPVCEELFFRGLLLRGFAAGFGPGRAVLYASLLFSALHGKELQLLILALLGAWFGLAVWLTGSVWAGVLAHALNNLAVLAATGIWGEGVRSVRAPAWLLGLSAFLFALSVAVLALERRRAVYGREGGGPGGAGG